MGIESRRTVLDIDYIRATKNADPRLAGEASIYSNATAGAKVLELALRDAALGPSDIGMLVAGGCSPQFTLPAEAAMIAAASGIEAPAFDLNAGCATFAFQLMMIAGLGYNAPPFVALLQVENNTRTIDYRDRSTAVLWGDGATAAIVSCSVPSPVTIRPMTFGSDSRRGGLIQTRVGGHFQQDGKAVQRFAIRKTVELFEDAKKSGEPDYFIGHQANSRMLETICDAAKVPAQRHLSNVRLFGNTGAAGAASVLAEGLHAGITGKVAVAVVGAGLAWGSMTVDAIPK